MVNMFYFIRHAHTRVDPSCSPKEWILSDEGIKQAASLASKDIFLNIDEIICSAEKKTYLTAQPLSEKLNIKIKTNSGFNEIGSNKLIKDYQIFDKLRYKCFMDLDYSEPGWESSRNGLSRFKDSITALENKEQNKKIVIVSHGTILTLFFADLLNILNNGSEVYKRWKELNFGVWGLVRNKKVIKDINEEE